MPRLQSCPCFPAFFDSIPYVVASQRWRGRVAHVPRIIPRPQKRGGRAGAMGAPPHKQSTGGGGEGQASNWSGWISTTAMLISGTATAVLTKMGACGWVLLHESRGRGSTHVTLAAPPRQSLCDLVAPNKMHPRHPGASQVRIRDRGCQQLRRHPTTTPTLSFWSLAHRCPRLPDCTQRNFLHRAAYELESVGTDGTLHHFEKPWALTATMFLGMALCLPVAYAEKYRERRKQQQQQLLDEKGGSRGTELRSGLQLVRRAATGGVWACCKRQTGNAVRAAPTGKGSPMQLHGGDGVGVEAQAPMCSVLGFPSLTPHPLAPKTNTQRCLTARSWPTPPSYRRRRCST